MKPGFHVFLPAFALLLLLTGKLPAAALPPNILVILADDLGYGDVHCNNPDRSKIPTPNIDALAAGGMRFTDGHSSSGVCSPSRYALLTGRYHWRTRLQSGIVGLWEQPLIADNRLTIGGLAKAQGYQTAAIGKWHLGSGWPIAESDRAYFGKADGARKTAPVDSAEARAAWARTFSQPIANGPVTRGFDRYFGTDVPNWPPYCFIENNRTVGIPSEYLPARFFQGKLASAHGPALPGWQLDPILPTLGSRAAAFIQEQAKAGQRFLLYLPLTAPHTPICPTAEWRGKSGLNAYGDFVMEVDATVGTVLAAVRESGAEENTLVLFTSDNGCSPQADIKFLESQGHFPSGPLRGYKADVLEGGHRVPFLVRWPARVRAGSVCGQLVHHADLIATLADIFGIKLPDNAGEDSFSLLPLLGGENRPVREHAISCSAGGVQGLRKGTWKLICREQPLLYDLASDLGEATDLAAAHPEIVTGLLALRESLIENGRSTPGALQKNDVAVRRLPAQRPPAPR